MSYNSKKLLKDFLPKIIATTPKSEEYEIWVVDNASVDNTWEYLDEEFPSVKKLRLEINRGFTNGYVQSLAQIQAKYYVLISSDIEVEGNWLLPPIEIMEQNPEFAAIQPKIKSFHQKELFEYAGGAGGFIDYLGYPFCRGRLINHLEEDKGQYDNNIETFWASGACMFINASLYHKARGLDNDFYAHMEEIDLCWRLKNMGYKIGYCHQSVVYHMGGFIITYGSPQKVFRNHRNNLLMLTKNLPFGQLIWKIPVRIALDALTFYKMVFDGEWKPATGIFKAHWEYFIYLPKWFAKRREVQKLFVKNQDRYGIFSNSIIKKVMLNGIKKFSDLAIKTNSI